MQSTTSYLPLLSNIREIIDYHQSEDLRIKYFGVTHGPTGIYLYQKGCLHDECTIVSEETMQSLIGELPKLVQDFCPNEILLEVVSCSPSLEEIGSDYLPNGYMEEVYSILS